MKTQSTGNSCACSVMHFQIPCAPPLEQFGEEKAQASSAPSDAISDRSPPVFPPLNLNTVRVRVVMS